MIKTARMTDQRITVRLTEDDEKALQTLQSHMRPLSFVSRVDIIRAAIQRAAQALCTSGVIG
jgi:hypothetical protein